MAHGPCCARSVRHDLGPNIFPSGPPTQSISTYYVKGIHVPIADALSRVSPQPAAANNQLPQLDIHYVTNTLPASQARLQHIREQTTVDPTLNRLIETLFRGWPDKREKCPVSLYDYWNFREELTIEDGRIPLEETLETRKKRSLSLL